MRSVDAENSTQKLSTRISLITAPIVTITIIYYPTFYKSLQALSYLFFKTTIAVGNYCYVPLSNEETGPQR
jgi:hypothetical protein